MPQQLSGGYLQKLLSTTTEAYSQLHTNDFQEWAARLTPIASRVYEDYLRSRLPRQAAYAQLTVPRHAHYATGEAQH